MRTVDPILTAALSTGKGRPYIKATIGYMNGTVLHTDDALAYELTGQTLKFHVEHISDFTGDQTAMWLGRGLTINGTLYSVTTGRFNLIHQTYMADGSMIAEGHIFPPTYYSANGYDTYKNVIDAFCTALGKTAVYADAGQAWLNYKFLANGDTIRLTDATKMLNLLAQKRLLTLCDNGNEEILVYCADVMPAIDFTLYPTHDWALAGSKLRLRQYIWRDQVGVYHQSGTATYPVHNLGYLEAAASPPSRTGWVYETDYLVPPNFEYQDGDTIKFILPSVKTFTFFGRIVEKYDPRSKSEPAWRIHIQANPIFESTEAGYYPAGMLAQVASRSVGAPPQRATIPDAMLNQMNYIPVNTSSFKHTLTANENNIQSALEKLDAYSIMPITHANDVFGINSSSSSGFTGTIASKGATTVVYNAGFTGNDNSLLAANTANHGKQVLFNTTRGNYGLISQSVVATKTITLTGNVPANWAAGDTITTLSPTVNSAGYVEIEIVSGDFFNKSVVFFLGKFVDTSGPGANVRLHPVEAFGGAKRLTLWSQVANVYTVDNLMPIKLVANRFSLNWTAAGAATLSLFVSESAYA